MFFESGRELDARQDIIAVMETVNAARGMKVVRGDMKSSPSPLTPKRADTAKSESCGKNRCRFRLLMATSAS